MACGCLLNCLHVIIIRDVGFYHFTHFCCFQFLLPEAVCCTTVIFVLCSLESMCRGVSRGGGGGGGLGVQTPPSGSRSLIIHCLI